MNVIVHLLTRPHIKVWVDGEQTKNVIIFSVLDAEEIARNKISEQLLQMPNYYGNGNGSEYL